MKITINKENDEGILEGDAKEIAEYYLAVKGEDGEETEVDYPGVKQQLEYLLYLINHNKIRVQKISDTNFTGGTGKQKLEIHYYKKT